MRNVVTMPVAAGRLFLLGLLLLCSLAPAWRPAPARAAGCAASLALHLRAGVPSPPGVTAYPPGIRAGPGADPARDGDHPRTALSGRGAHNRAGDDAPLRRAWHPVPQVGGRDLSAARRCRHGTAVVNALPRIDAGMHSCPADLGQSATLIFQRRNGQQIRVYDEPTCVGVVVGRYPALWDLSRPSGMPSPRSSTRAARPRRRPWGCCRNPYPPRRPADPRSGAGLHASRTRERRQLPVRHVSRSARARPIGQLRLRGG